MRHMYPEGPKFMYRIALLNRSHMHHSKIHMGLGLGRTLPRLQPCTFKTVVLLQGSYSLLDPRRNGVAAPLSFVQNATQGGEVAVYDINRQKRSAEFLRKQQRRCVKCMSPQLTSHGYTDCSISNLGCMNIRKYACHEHRYTRWMSRVRSRL